MPNEYFTPDFAVTFQAAQVLPRPESYTRFIPDLRRLIA